MIIRWKYETEDGFTGPKRYNMIVVKSVDADFMKTALYFLKNCLIFFMKGAFIIRKIFHLTAILHCRK